MLLWRKRGACGMKCFLKAVWFEGLSSSGCGRASCFGNGEANVVEEEWKCG
jgi:hypothetical protein